MSIAVIVLFFIFAALQGLDLYSTLEALHTAGNYELNPVLKYVAAHIGMDATLIVVKSLATLFIWFIVCHFRHTWQMAALLVLLDAFYAWVVYHNFSLIK